MVARGTTESPKRVLKAFGESHEALAAKDHMAMLETGIGKAEMVKPVIEALFSDNNPELVHVGEIGQSEPPGLLGLPENDLLLFAMQGTP